MPLTSTRSPACSAVGGLRGRAGREGDPDPTLRPFLGGGEGGGVGTVGGAAGGVGRGGYLRRLTRRAWAGTGMRDQARPPSAPGSTHLLGNLHPLVELGQSVAAAQEAGDGLHRLVAQARAPLPALFPEVVGAQLGVLEDPGRVRLDVTVAGYRTHGLVH